MFSHSIVNFHLFFALLSAVPNIDGLTFTCPGDGHFGDPDDCNSYYLCSSGQPTALKYKCGEGLLWDRKRNLCDWAANVNCGIESSETVTESKEQDDSPPPVVSISENQDDEDFDPDIYPPIRPSTQEPIPNYCQQKEDGKYPNLRKKCRQYYACSDGEMIQLKMCDEGTVFDGQRLSCERPVYVAPPCGSALYSLTDYTKGRNGATVGRISTLLPGLFMSLAFLCY